MLKKELSFFVSSVILPRLVPLIFVMMMLLRLFDLKGLIGGRSYSEGHFAEFMHLNIFYFYFFLFKDPGVECLSVCGMWPGVFWWRSWGSPLQSCNG